MRKIANLLGSPRGIGCKSQRRSRVSNDSEVGHRLSTRIWRRDDGKGLKERGRGMACQAHSPVPPARFSGTVHCHPSSSSWHCRQPLFGSSFSSRRKLSLSCMYWTTLRGDSEAGGVAPSKLSRIPRTRLFSASNLAGSITASCTEVAIDNNWGPTSKPLKEYIVREAKLDEELSAAAWIRAESYCEEQPYVRYIESYKKRFAEQEFDALKRRLLGKYGQSIRCICLVAVNGQSSQNCTMNGSETILNRVVGTLDLSIRQLSPGETFAGDSIRPTLSMGAIDVRGSQRYGYIANVCVTKHARRNGIASSLLGTAIKAAKDWGLNELYVHVNSSNKAASCLYSNYNFQKMQAGAVQVGVQHVILLQRHL